MADYTIDIRHLLQRGYKLALDTYPIWSENYREILNRKIIDHYMFREIGQETPDRFNFFLNRKMHEIMPYYNQMYESQLIEFDPLATEYFKEGTDYSRRKDEENISKYKDKTNETNGEVYSGNKDSTQDVGFEHKTSEVGTGNYSKSGKTEEELREKTTAENTQTTDMNVKGTTKTIGDSTTTVTSSQTTTFSDIPQAGIETTRVIAPDGTITETTKGYATTTTNVVGTEKTVGHTEENSESNQDTTGTVENDGSGTKNNDNVIDTTESGNSGSTSTIDTSESTGTKGNSKEDYERNIATERKTNGDRKESTGVDEKSNQTVTSKGRKGQVPAELIMKYRQSFINVDMMVIDELETLFMGVF